MLIAGVVLLTLLSSGGRRLRPSRTCTYTTYTWNVRLARAVDRRTVQHAYSELSSSEIHSPTGCTVCEEDQAEITLPGVTSFRICQRLAKDVRDALAAGVASGASLLTVTGYRVGMTKGEVDDLGNRTQFSLHSYGVALDVNRQQNGLYDNCPVFGPNCRLLQGGPWRPGQPGSLTPDGPLVRALQRIGLQWGGAVRGRQKDFMHFSPSGY